MKPKRITATADATIDQIAEYIHKENPDAAFRYLEAVYAKIDTFDERFLPRRASETLPENIREISVSGFRGYTLRVAVFDEEMVFLAAFAPGLSTERKNRRTRFGFDELQPPQE